MEETIKQIFKEIDQAIERNISDKPVPFRESKFNKDYQKIKEKYLNE